MALDTKLYNRQILTSLKSDIFSPYIVIITGSRRVGKTSLLHLIQNKILESNYDKGNILYFDLENPIFLETFQIKDYDLLANNLISQAKNKKEKIFVFLDEIQYLKGASGLLKYLFDHYKNIKLFVSGSSSLKIKKIFSDSMVGRKRFFRLFPLSFREFLMFKNKSDLLKDIPHCNILSKNFDPESNKLLPYQKSELNSELEDFFTYGGYPETTLLEDINERKKSLFEFYISYIQKDISFLFSIENIDKFNKLVKLYASQIGSLVNFSEISNTIALTRETIDRYSFLLESTFALEFLRPYYTNLRKEITKMPKIYFEDVGVRNAVMNTFNNKELSIQGSIAENFIFNELRKNYPNSEVHFWRTKSRQEVDFIIEHEGNIIPIEVKNKNMKNPIVPSGLKSFINYYSPTTAIIATKNLYTVSKLGNTRIIWIPIYLF